MNAFFPRAIGSRINNVLELLNDEVLGKKQDVKLFACLSLIILTIIKQSINKRAKSAWTKYFHSSNVDVCV